MKKTRIAKQKTRHNAAAGDNQNISTDATPPDDASEMNPHLLIGFQGESGGFADMAARRVFGELRDKNLPRSGAFQVTGYPQVAALLEALHERDLDYVLVANDDWMSSTNPVVLGKMVSLQLKIMGEVTSTDPVTIFALPGTAFHNADCIMSDWSLLQRFEPFILQLEATYKTNIVRHVVWDSPVACRIIREEGAVNTMVLCSKEAGEANGLVLLHDGVDCAAVPSKYTIVGRHDAPALDFQREEPSRLRRQCTLVINSTGQGALLDILGILTYWNAVIDYFRMRGISDVSERPTQTSLITYRPNPNETLETSLRSHLAAASEKVISLGYYTTKDG